MVRRGSRLLLVQRPDHGRWSGLWEFPHGVVQAGEMHEGAAHRLVAERVGVQTEVGSEIMTLRHSVTHHRITLVCFEAQYRAGRFASRFYAEGKWINPGQLGEFPVSAPQRRLAHALTQKARQRRLF